MREALAELVVTAHVIEMGVTGDRNAGLLTDLRHLLAQAGASADAAREAPPVAASGG